MYMLSLCFIISHVLMFVLHNTYESLHLQLPGDLQVSPVLLCMDLVFYHRQIPLLHYSTKLCYVPLAIGLVI